MFSTHIHLVLTHVPIVGILLSVLILLYGFFAKNQTISKLAFALITLMALITIPVFFSGNQAEEYVEHIPGLSGQLIEKHESIAEFAVWFIGILGVLSFLGLFMSKKNRLLYRIIHILIIMLSIITFGVFAKVGETGGQIRHSEIRKTNSPINTNKEGVKNNQSERKYNFEEEDDEDEDD